MSRSHSRGGSYFVGNHVRSWRQLGVCFPGILGPTLYADSNFHSVIPKPAASLGKLLQLLSLRPNSDLLNQKLWEQGPACHQALQVIRSIMRFEKHCLQSWLDLPSFSLTRPRPQSWEDLPTYQCTHGYWQFVMMMMTCNTNQEPSLSGTSYGMSGRELWFFIYLGFKVFNIMDLMDLTPHKLELCRFGTKGNFYHVKKASKQLFFQ